MGNKDETLPNESDYPYMWSPNSSSTLPEFMLRCRPSMVQDDGTKPWIWVRGSETPKRDADEDAAIEEAQALLNEVTQEVERIKNDPQIPIRFNKKTGAKSKKEMREQVQADAIEKLKEISIRHNFVNGKWLIFAPPEKVDTIWLSVAQSLASGPLSRTVAYCTKVATSPRLEIPNYQHVICVYLPDVYDKESVTDVMKVLLRDHGINLSGVKSDLYTLIGLDSKHPSGIPSTVWKNTALMKDTEIKELKDAYFSALKTTPVIPPTASATPAPSSTTNASVSEIAANAKNEALVASAAEGTNPPTRKQLVKKRKAEEDDPFASDNDDAVSSTNPAPKPASSNAKPPSKAQGVKPASKAKTKPPSKASPQQAAHKGTTRKVPLKKKKVEEEEFVSGDE